MTISDGDTYKSKNLQLNNGKDLEMPYVFFKKIFLPGVVSFVSLA